MEEDLSIERANLKSLRKKNLTKDTGKYDYIDIPQLSVKEIQASLKLVDTFTLNQVIEFLKADYFELVKSIADNINDESKHTVAIASNAVRRRTEAWIEALSRYKTKDEFLNKMTGETQRIKK